LPDAIHNEHEHVKCFKSLGPAAESFFTMSTQTVARNATAAALQINPSTCYFNQEQVTSIKLPTEAKSTF
jgi:hypothetical protein